MLGGDTVCEICKGDKYDFDTGYECPKCNKESDYK
jgi:hypothetical protein